ncbi:MAG: GNAT family N-acetyltransferase [Candidatus Dormibacteraeota bacterium]|nr:GNAT family N-acetyltransferase [Candidatus Dormibacteraeota bacterium]MBV9525399.1 GNAT family N-acetyltransferase [Candidatus Dormibacteraeota bacterium]
MSRAALLRREGPTHDGRRYLLRPAGDGDAEALIALQDGVAAEGGLIAAAPGMRSALEESVSLGVLLAGGGLSIVVEVEGVLAGHLEVRRGSETHTQHRGELAIIVGNEHRGQGLGRVLMNTAIEWARAVGLETLSLGVFATNTRAIRLYREVGFVSGGHGPTRIRTHDGDHDLLLMNLTL